MMKILRKRILKIFPVWLLIALLFSTGVALAGYVWISNYIVTTTNVTLPPLTLSGTIPTTVYQGLDASQNCTYVVNSGTPIGYVHLKIVGDITSVSDVGAWIWVYPTGASVGTYGIAVAGYPKYTTNSLEFVWQNMTSSAPFNFGSTGGKIEVTLYNMVKIGSYMSQLQITSTPT